MSEERLARIETKVDGLHSLVKSRIQHDDERYGRVARTIYGHNGSAGVLIELDRLKQAQERSQWLMRTVIAAIIVLALGGLWSLVK